MSVDQVQQSEQGIPDLHEHDDGVSQLLQDNLNISSYLLDLRHFFFECPFTDVCKRGVGSNQNKNGANRKSVKDNLRTLVSTKNGNYYFVVCPTFFDLPSSRHFDKFYGVYFLNIYYVDMLT